MLHGKINAKKSEKTAKEIFSENSSGLNLPSIKINNSILEKNTNIIDLIFILKLEKSKSEIRRLVKGNAIRINNKTINDEKFLIKRNLFKENFLRLSVGKKRHLKITLA